MCVNEVEFGWKRDREGDSLNAANSARETSRATLLGLLSFGKGSYQLQLHRIRRCCTNVRDTVAVTIPCRKGNIVATVIYNPAIYRGQLPEEHSKTKHPLCTYTWVHEVVCGVYINFTGVILAASYRVHAFIISPGSHLLGKVY